MTLILTEDHRYFDNDIEFPGVTTVIREAGLMGSWQPQDLEWYFQRGTAIHEATALYDQGILDKSTIDPRIQGYLDAWKKFRTDTGHGSAFIEKSLCHPLYKYCGTLDRDELDIKSGNSQPWHLIQGAAYCALRNTTLIPVWSTIYLQEDGNYKVISYKPKEILDAFKIFLAALAIYNWRKNNNVNNRT